MNKSDFYKNPQPFKIEWWLSSCHNYPDLYWARLKVFSDGKADVAFQDENKVYGFTKREYAEYFLGEDEFWAFNRIDEDDKKELEIPLDIEIKLPAWSAKIFEEFIYIGEY